MYTIRQAASRSGVSVPLLRAWERRYGIVRPERTASGYRLYDEPAIARLRAMRRLVHDGWAPSTAAAHLVAGGDDAVGAILAAERQRLPERGAEDDGGANASLVDRFVEAARGLDEPTLEAVLDEMFARGSFERAAAELVMPALVALGQGWADGTVDVAAEHAATGAVMRRLGAAFLAAARSERDASPHVLVGLPPGARHESGALAFATGARRSGIAVRYLGADLPVDDWVAATRQADAIAAVVGVVVDRDAGAAADVSAALRAARPAILVAFGGAFAGAVRIADAAHEIQLPAELLPAIERLRSAIRSATAASPA